jgi:hypothetical protein
MSTLSSTSLAWIAIDSTAASSAASMPRFSAIGLAPAATFPKTLLHHGLRQHGGRRRPISRHVFGLLGDFLDELGADVLLRVFQVKLARYGDTIVGDRRHAPVPCEHHVAAFRSERDLDRCRDLVESSLEGTTSLSVQRDQLGCDVSFVVGWSCKDCMAARGDPPSMMPSCSSPDWIHRAPQ